MKLEGGTDVFRGPGLVRSLSMRTYLISAPLSRPLTIAGASMIFMFLSVAT